MVVQTRRARARTTEVLAALAALGMVLCFFTVVDAGKSAAAELPPAPRVCPEGTPDTIFRDCIYEYDEAKITASKQVITFPEAYPACMGRSEEQSGFCESLTIEVSLPDPLPFCADVEDGIDCIDDIEWDRGDYATWGVPEGHHRASLYVGSLFPACAGRNLTCDRYRLYTNLDREIDGFGWLVLRPVRIEIKTHDVPEDNEDGHVFSSYRPEVAVYVPPPTEDPPVADFSWEIPDPEKQDFVRFTSTSTEPYGSVLSTDWDFGDGRTGSGDVAIHRYLESGFYTVTITVRSWGTDLTASKSISIHVDVPDEDLPLVVNSTGDAPAEDPAEGCDTGAEIDDDPECTLRAAIQTANAGGQGGSTIGFAIPGASLPTIELESALPAITKATTIDGTTQSGGRVVLDAGVAEQALDVKAANSQVRGLVIVDAPIGVLVDAGQVLLEGLTVGVMPDGTTLGTVDYPVYVRSGSGSRLLDSHLASPNSVVIVAPDASATEVKSNLLGVTADASAPLGNGGVVVAGAGTVVEDNTIAGGEHVGVGVLSETARGSVVRGNRIGTSTTAAYADQGPGIRVDGAPDVQVLDNVIVSSKPAAAGRAAGISVTGVPQASERTTEDGTVITWSQYDDGLYDGDATGTGIVVQGNTIGSAAAGVTAPATEVPDGIQVWAEAADVTVRDNLVHGPTLAGVVVDDSTQVDLVGNRVAPDDAEGRPTTGITVIGGEGLAIGNDVAGNQVTAESIGIEIEGETADVAVATNQIATSEDAPDSVCLQSSVTLRVTGNVFDCARGVNLVPDREPISGPAIEHNILTVEILGIGAEADQTTVADNQVTGGDNAGIAVTGEAMEVTANTVTGAGTGILVDGADAQVDGNTVTDSGSDGIAVGSGPAIVDDNEVTGSGGRGIAVAPGVEQVTLEGNRIAGTTGAPIAAPDGPAAPSIDAVVLDTTGEQARTTLVINGLPAEASGTVELFANESCADPEAERVLDVVREVDGTRDSLVVRLLGRANIDHYTAIFTDADGSSSVLSTCAEATDHPDTDGDGVVDPIDDLSDVADDPSRVTLVTDDEQILAVTAIGLGGEDVGFTAAAVADDPDAGGHAGTAFPFGVVRFSLDGVTPGEKAAVRFVVLHGDDLPATAGYWKYDAAAEGWYEFSRDAATETGAQMVPGAIDVPGYGLRRALAVVLADGGRGDLDRVANGQIVDPGAITVSATAGNGSPEVGLPDVDFPDEVTGEGLPDTGGPEGELLPLAFSLIVVGMLLVLRARRANRYAV